MTWGTDMMNAPGQPKPQRGEWDGVTFAGSPCPGVCEVTVSLSADIDKRKPKGVKKSQAIDRGANPAKVKVTVTLLPGDFDAFSEISPLIFPFSKTEAQEPIEVTHPALEFWGLNLFIVESAEQEHPSGVMVITISLLEWIAQPSEVKPKQKPKDGTPDPAPGAELSPGDQTELDKMFTR